MKVLREEDSPYTDRLILLIASDCVFAVFAAYRAREHRTSKQNPGEKKSIYQHESMIFVGKQSNMPAVTIA